MAKCSSAAFHVSCSDVSCDLFYYEDMWPEGCLLHDWHFKCQASTRSSHLDDPFMAATNSTRMLLRVCSFNMHGYKIGSSFLADLCKMSDIILIQEHWLSPDCLHLLSSVNDNFVYFSNSAMSSKLARHVFRGRPFGGVGVLVLVTCKKYFSDC